jgi:BMFP domain-containing protein YqiC
MLQFGAPGCKLAPNRAKNLTLENNMTNQHFFDDMTEKFKSLMAGSPIADFEKNAKAYLAGLATQMDLVTRDDLENALLRQRSLEEKINLLEKRLAELEK